MTFMQNSMFFLVLLLLLAVCHGHSGSGRHSGHEHRQPQKDGPKNILKDKEYLRDYEHIKEDVQEMYNKDFAEKLDETDMEIFYFQLHDLDNDQQLDGLELLAAMNHIAVRQSDISNEDLAKYPEGRQQLQNWWNEKFEEDAQFIDEILKEEDIDQNGYLDYFEFVLGRQRLTV